MKVDGGKCAAADHGNSGLWTMNRAAPGSLQLLSRSVTPGIPGGWGFVGLCMNTKATATGIEGRSMP